MNLYLMQHADAVDDSVDPERPLSDTGRAAIESVARFAGKQLNLEVLAVTHSGKLRAKQTAEILFRHIACLQGVVPVKDLEPNAHPGIWQERLALMEDDVVLVGHLPHLASLAGLLLCGDPDASPVEFKNAGLVCLHKHGNAWSLRWAITPDMLPE